MPIHTEMPVWKGRDEKRPQFIVTRDFIDGDGARETRFVMDAHTGHTSTHRSTLCRAGKRWTKSPWSSSFVG